ncbi:hypothetical protein C8R32_101374 [Nitrosospira sp. Nsp5]|uniref:Uncharacterized protein n=1 Tax=Nitrosospira multiformis TaxID=1231 RepID=A0ABY0TK82_9PROT|nr:MULTISPECIES: hypothetical protein [Nitrosospira]PTR10844.1 hypothetical protein C8R32_101374 [Nitrosospira sp. Nsp5]SDQ73666.1 hypothetical protein SAMN05216402_2081 [Nitrosospira multiformis]
MFNFGAFAGGLAEGARSGQNMALRQKQAARIARADEREAEIHGARMDKAAYHKGTRDRLRAANDEIAAGWEETMQQPSAILKPGLPSSGPDALLEANPISRQSTGGDSVSGLQSEIPAAPADHGAGLMSLHKESAGQKNRPGAPASADEMIARRMLTGNLLDDPDELTRMAGIYKKHGLLAEMAPWMNKAWEAKKKRIPDALSLLLSGDAKGARAILKKGGINLADDPIPANPDDPQSSWKFRFEDGAAQDVNLKELAIRFFPSSMLSR